MSKKRVKITLLCEDKQQEVFARYFLEKYGFTAILDQIRYKNTILKAQSRDHNVGTN